ncbi:hypothetical protein BS47DRAFT_1338200 [Hydnum rufescens UP504]|uniref:Uncharacterized protein n=1 Tax=Hydnum rufescens UP504 TaxID=1448309 RepID=A0A9P6B6F7_9AGAM|nr:hypothetical protein BS47DRAFT_1338200 [Hydnum rufescens UP504]
MACVPLCTFCPSHPNPKILRDGNTLQFVILWVHSERVHCSCSRVGSVSACQLSAVAREVLKRTLDLLTEGRSHEDSNKFCNKIVRAAVFHRTRSPSDRRGFFGLAFEPGHGIPLFAARLTNSISFPALPVPFAVFEAFKIIRAHRSKPQAPRSGESSSADDEPGCDTAS